MPQKLNKAGKMQDYIPKGNGDASGEYGTNAGTGNKNVKLSSGKKETKANVISENKSVVVGDKKKDYTITKKKLKTRKGEFEYDIIDKLPDGWRVNPDATTAPNGYVWVDNKKSLFGGERESAIIKREALDKQFETEDYKGYDITKEGNYYVAYINGDGTLWKTREEARQYIDSKTNKANIINDDLTGKKYDDSDIRNMSEDEFDGVVSTKELWENTTKEYEKAKPVLDKMGIKIEDVKFHKDKRTKDDTDNITELVYQKTGTYSGRTEEEKKAIMRLTDKVYLDKTTREFKMPKKTNKIS